MVTSTSLLKNCTTGSSLLHFKPLNTSCMDACQSKLESTPAKKRTPEHKKPTPVPVKPEPTYNIMAAHDNYVHVNPMHSKNSSGSATSVNSSGSVASVKGVFLYVVVTVIFLLILGGLYIKNKKFGEQMGKQMGGAIMGFLELE